jgi:hypothetical protein
LAGIWSAGVSVIFEADDEPTKKSRIFDRAWWVPVMDPGGRTRRRRPASCCPRCGAIVIDPLAAT